MKRTHFENSNEKIQILENAFFVLNQYYFLLLIELFKFLYYCIKVLSSFLGQIQDFDFDQSDHRQ